MKRGCSLLLAVLLLLSTLAGCGKEEVEIRNTPEKLETTTAAADSTAETKKVELRFSNWGDSTEQQMFEDIFKRFSEENPDITVKYIFIPWTEYITKLNAMAATNSLPDMGQMIEHSSLKWANNNMFLDVSDLYASGEIGERLSSITFSKTKNGFLGSSYISEILTLFYDRDYTDSMGVKVPATLEEGWNWEEFVAAAKKLTVDQNGKHPDDPGFDPNKISVYGIADVNANVMAWSNGGGLFNPECTEIWLDKPETIEAYQAAADLMNVHHVAPTSASRGALGGGNNVLLTKKVAMSFAPQYQLLWYGEYIKKGTLNLGVGVLPRMKNYATQAFGPAVVIFKQTENPEASKRLLRYFYDTENIITNIHQGLWMPSEKKYFEDELLISKWIDESPLHPKEYKTAVVPLALNYAIPDPFYKLPNTNEINSIVTPLLDQVWAGKKKAGDVIIDEIMPKLQKYMDKYWAENPPVE